MGGRWDPITKLFCIHRRESLQTLSDDCIKKSNGEILIGEGCNNSIEDDTYGNDGNDNEELKKGKDEFLRTAKSAEGVELIHKNNKIIGAPIISPTGRENPITKIFGGRRESKKSNDENSIGEGSNSNEDDKFQSNCCGITPRFMEDNESKGKVKSTNADADADADADVNIDTNLTLLLSDHTVKVEGTF